MAGLRFLRWPLIVLGSAFLTLAAIFALNPDWVRVQSLQIDLFQDSEQRELFERLKPAVNESLRPYEGRFFWQISLPKVYEEITKDRRVKRASVYREFPSRLRIEIEPHTPVIAYMDSKGRIHPVATDATLLPTIPLKDAADMPLLRGKEFGIDQKLREQALALVNALPSDGLFSRGQVSEILFHKKDGFKVFLSGVESEIRLGDSDFGPKARRVAKVIEYLDSRDIKGRVIDARYAKKVVVRVRNTP